MYLIVHPLFQGIDKFELYRMIIRNIIEKIPDEQGKVYRITGSPYIPFTMDKCLDPLLGHCSRDIEGTE